MAFRSPGGLGYADNLRRGGGESWDRERLERVGRQLGDRGGIGGRQYQPTRFEEPDPYYEEELRFGRPRRPAFLDEPTQGEVANRALAPYRRQSIHEREPEIPIRRPPRPRYMRRQSSLDTFDRRPLPRYGDHIYEGEYHEPRPVPVALPVRPREPNLYTPPRQYREHEYESVHYHHHDSSDSDSHAKISIHRDRSKVARSVKAKTVRSSSSSSSSSGVTTTTKASNKVGKRGKTRIPKRLARKEVIISFGYPYEEEDECFVIKRALQKEHIDEVIRVSKTYKESRTTYRYEEPKQPEPIVIPEPVTQATEVEQTTVKKEYYKPPSPQPVHYHIPEPVHYHPPPEPVHYHPPPEPVHYHPPPEPVIVAQPPRHHHHVYRDEYVEESGPLVLAKPAHHSHRGHAHRHDREIKAEIRALEAEKRALKLEREAENKLVQADRVRDGDSAYGGIAPGGGARDLVRVEKDRKVNPKVVAAMMATLT